jgi:uncharacterized membrane protein YhaH (DUF805 family)
MHAAGYLFSFGGRTNRAGYWIFVLIAVVYLLQLGGVAFRVLAKDPDNPILIGEIGVFVIPLVVASLAVTARRLHDCGLSAWWLLLFLIAPSVLAGIGAILALEAGGENPLSLALELVGAVISTWGFVQLGCLRGTVGNNRFGADPLVVAAHLVPDTEAKPLVRAPLSPRPAT